MRRIILCIFCLSLLAGIAGAVTLDTESYTYVADDDHSITIGFTVTPNDVDGYVDTYVDGKYLDTRSCPAGSKYSITFYSKKIGDHLLELRYYTDDPNDYVSKNVVVKVKHYGTLIPEYSSIAIPAVALIGLLMVFGKKKQ